VNKPLLSVEMTDHSVSVVGLLEQDVNTVVAGINKAIKDNKILQTELVDLKADQARERYERQVRIERNGDGAGYTKTVSVEGPPEVVQLSQAAVDKSLHTTFDFQKVCKEGNSYLSNAIETFYL